MIKKEFTVFVPEQSDLERNGQLSLFEKTIDRNARISRKELSALLEKCR